MIYCHGAFSDDVLFLQHLCHRNLSLGISHAHDVDTCCSIECHLLRANSLGNLCTIHRVNLDACSIYTLHIECFAFNLCISVAFSCRIVDAVHFGLFAGIEIGYTLIC